MDVPYRCPRCGDGKTFPVLSDLKEHLSSAHAYVPTPRKRVQVFNGNNSGRYSPLLQSFHDEGARLERELQDAKEMEMNNKIKRYGEDGEMKMNRSEIMPSVQSEFTRSNKVSFQDEQLRNVLNTMQQNGNINGQTAPLQQNNGHMNFQYQPSNMQIQPVVMMKHNDEQGVQYNPQGTIQHSNGAIIQNHQSFRQNENAVQHNPVQGHGYSNIHQQGYDMNIQNSQGHVHPENHYGSNNMQHDNGQFHGHPVQPPHHQQNMSNTFMRRDDVSSNSGDGPDGRPPEQRSSIQKLSQELKGKEDDLKNSEKELDRLRAEQNNLLESAEILARKTNEESQRLSEELEAKEFQLSRINSKLADLRQNSLEDLAAQQRQTPLKIDNDAKNVKMERNLIQRQKNVGRRSDFANDSRQGFNHSNVSSGRGKEAKSSFEQTEKEIEELDILSQELRKMQRDAVQKMQEKDKELIRAKRRSEKLENDRLVLLHEMDNLLSKANTDNEKLKSELKNKDYELKEFNTNLEDAKKEQSKLVGETFELYKEADKNIAKLKEMLALKDFQLQAANEKLNQFQIANEQLLVESESIANHADEKGNIMASMLETTNQNLQEMEQELNKTKYEKEKLEEEAQTLKQEVDARSRSLEQLQDEVLKKEEELEKTNDDLKTLQTFLQTTAAKESVARQELEKFIMELIARADNAEKELRVLRRQVREASLSESKSAESTHIPTSLHQTLTEDVINTTTAQISPRKNLEERRPKPQRSFSEETPSSRSRHETSEKKKKRKEHSPHHSQEYPEQRREQDIGYQQTGYSKPAPKQRFDRHHVIGQQQSQFNPNQGLPVQQYQQSQNFQHDNVPYQGNPTFSYTNQSHNPGGVPYQSQPNFGQGGSVNMDKSYRYPNPTVPQEAQQRVQNLNQPISGQNHHMLGQGHPVNPTRGPPIGGQYSNQPMTGQGHFANSYNQGLPMSVESSTEPMAGQIQLSNTQDQRSHGSQGQNYNQQRTYSLNPSINISSNQPLQNTNPSEAPQNVHREFSQNPRVTSQGTSTSERDLSTGHSDIARTVTSNTGNTGSEGPGKEKTMDKSKAEVSEIGIQTEKPKSVKLSDNVECESCHTYVKDDKSEIPKKEKVKFESDPSTVCSKCLRKGTIPVPKYTSTPKKIPRTSKGYCKHCHHSMDEETSDSDMEPHPKKPLLTARSVVLARIMGDEAKVSRTIPKEERLWQTLESKPKWRDQVDAADISYEAGMRGRGTSLSNQFDRIRPSQTHYRTSSAPLRQTQEDLIGSGAGRQPLDKLEKRYEESRSLVSRPLSGYGVESDRGIQYSYSESFPKDKSDSLSDRIDKLEKMISENRTRSNEKLGKVLNEVIADSSKISTREDIKRLRESITPRLNPVRTRNVERSRDLNANIGNTSSSLRPAGHGNSTIAPLERRTVPLNNDMISSPQSSDSYVGLPSGNTKPGESTSQSYPTYRSSDNGLIIRNNFYGDKDHNPSRSQQYSPYPIQRPDQPVQPQYSFQPQHSLQPQAAGPFGGYPQGYQAQYHGGSDRGTHRTMMSPPLYQTPSGQYYEHFPQVLNPSVHPGARQYVGNREQLWKDPRQGFDYSFVKRNEEFDLKKGLMSPNLSTDSEASVGQELSVDENGILWDEDQADTGVSEDLDSFRLSPSGSETAGDVDSSLLLSGSGSWRADGHLQKADGHFQKADGHLQTLDGIAETDEESSYCGLPGSGRKGHGGKAEKFDVKGGKALSRDFTDSSKKEIRTDKGGMVSDIVSVRDKMMKYLDEDDLKGIRKNTRNQKSGQNCSTEPLFGDVEKDTIGSTKTEKSLEIPKISSNVNDDKLQANLPSSLRYIDSSGDNSSSSYTPLRASGSKSKVISGSFELDDMKKKSPKAAPRDINEVVEEVIQPQSKASNRAPLDLSKKLNLLSSSSESLEQSPRRKPVAKKRNIKDDKPNGKEEPSVIANDNLQEKDTDTDPKGLNLEIPHSGTQHVPDLQRTKPSLETRDSVLGTSIGSDPKEVSNKLLKNEESGLTSSLDSLDDLAKYDNVPLKKAEPLRLTFADEMTTDDDLSRGSAGGLPEASPALCKDESTDFDFESDLERLSTPLQLKPGKGRSKRNKVLTHKKARGSSSRRLSVPKVHADESSDAGSDITKKTKDRHEAGRRRRVALFCVFRYLDTRTLSQMALVNREWRHVSRHPELWKKIELKNERISSSFLATIAQWCSRLQQLSLEGLQCRQRRSEESLDEYQQNTRGCLEAGLEELLKCCQNSLVSLQIIACGNILTNKCLWLASCYCRLLEKLHYISNSDPVTAEVLWAIGGGCPGVTTLVVPPLYPCLKPKSFTNKCLVLIAKFYPDLLQLGIGGQEISIGGLLPLVQGCQRLQYLELDHMVELTSDDVTALCRAGLRQLSVLEINATPITPDAVKQINKSCRHLKRLRILLDIHDFFEDTTKKKNIQEYNKTIKKLQDLQKQPGLGNVLKLQAASID